MKNRLQFFKFLVTAAISALFTLSAVAQSTTSTSTVSAPETSSAWQKSIMLGLKSYNDSGRISAFEEKEGRIFKGKEEFFVGYKHNSGWGSFVTLTQNRFEFNKTATANKNRWQASDPSLSLAHPDWYKDENLTFSGYARTYHPYTDGSKAVDKRQWAYYLNTVYKARNGHEVINTLTPRWFVQNSYIKTDTDFYVEDRTIYNIPISKSMRFGAQQYTQVEQHYNTSAGTTVELIPSFDYMWSSKTFIGPRINLPVYVNGSVYDAPKAVATDNALAQIYFQTSL